MSRTDPFDETRRWFKNQPKSRLIMAALIIIGTFYVLFGFGYDEEHHKQINYELKLARHLCENSYNWIMADPKRLKMGQGDLRDVRIKGKKIELELVKYPKVIFLDSGITNIGRDKTATDLYCVFHDPRSTSREFYYKYDQRIWVDKVRFHR